MNTDELKEMLLQQHTLKKKREELSKEMKAQGELYEKFAQHIQSGSGRIAMTKAEMPAGEDVFFYFPAYELRSPSTLAQFLFQLSDVDSQLSALDRKLK